MISDKGCLLRTTPGRRLAAIAAGSAVAAGLLAGCNPSSATPSGKIAIVAAENEYGNVASQIGGKYVSVSSIESNPNTDPHDYEVSPEVASQVSGAEIVIQNGCGYDTFMNKIESADPGSSRKVIEVQQLLGLPGDTPNPHLWYSPKTMPAVEEALVSDLSAILPSHASYFKANGARFGTSLKPWLDALARFKATYPGTPAATTEPVADYMLEAAGVDDLTPFGLQADIMNGVDPSPEDVTAQSSLLQDHKVKVFVYNEQVTDPLTESFISDARAGAVPVIGVYETMPVPGYDYQSWMLAEVSALDKAVAGKVSTVKL